MRNLELPGRSPVASMNGMASTSHALATQVAVSILQRGGNAMDAAIAACAVQCVVEPGSTGLGGDCFCLYAPGGGTDYVAYNGSGRAPAAATTAWYARHGLTGIERQSPHAVTVPGAVDAWDQLLRDHGSLSMADVLQPAIELAEGGYPITSRVSHDFAKNARLLGECDNASRVFLQNGSPPKEGDVHVQPELAQTMRLIGQKGREAFYSGEIADDIVRFLQGRGGLHSLEDFATAKGEYVTPITAKFMGYDIYQCPPNGQGVIALILLKLIQRFDRVGDTPINLARVHQEIEAGRMAYYLRDAYVTDPDQFDVPVDYLLSDAHIDKLYQSFNAEKAMKAPPDFVPTAHRDTVYITVVDKDRNACSLINTLFHPFGAVLMAPKSGVMLQNRGQSFSLDPGHPNSIAPHKRPLHTIIPGMAAKDGKTVLCYGVMGGAYQAFGHLQFLSRHLQYGYDIQQSQDLPRFFPNPETGKVEVESPVPADILEGLRAMGHSPVPAENPIGGSQAIRIDWDKGTLIGGSDPRKDGCAIGY